MDTAHVGEVGTDGGVPRFPVERVLFGVFAGVAVLMFGVAAATGLTTARALAREQTAPGRVVALTSRTVSVPVDTDDPARRRSVDREFFYPVIEFDLPDGTRRTVQTAEGSWPPAYAVGEAVAVCYDPDHPASGRIRSASGAAILWTWTIVTGVVGLAFGVAALLIRRFCLGQP